MKLSNNEGCVVVLTRKDVTVNFNSENEVTFKANHMMLISCKNNVIDFSELDDSAVLYLNKDVIKDYIHFLKKDISALSPNLRSTPCYMIERCQTPHIFQEAVRLSQDAQGCEVDRERSRCLSFTVLSIFLSNNNLIPFLIREIRSNLSANVYSIIQSNMHKEWSLTSVASCLCLSPSSLKKKLKNEDTTYSKIITDCRMRYAVEQLIVFNKNISQVSSLCGYSSTSYFISVFKEYYGTTPLNYVHQHRDKMIA